MIFSLSSEWWFSLSTLDGSFFFLFLMVIFSLCTEWQFFPCSGWHFFPCVLSVIFFCFFAAVLGSSFLSVLGVVVFFLCSGGGFLSVSTFLAKELSSDGLQHGSTCSFCH